MFAAGQRGCGSGRQLGSWQSSTGAAAGAGRHQALARRPPLAHLGEDTDLQGWAAAGDHHTATGDHHTGGRRRRPRGARRRRGGAQTDCTRLGSAPQTPQPSPCCPRWRRPRRPLRLPSALVKTWRTRRCPFAGQEDGSGVVRLTDQRAGWALAPEAPLARLLRTSCRRGASCMACLSAAPVAAWNTISSAPIPRISAPRLEACAQPLHATHAVADAGQRNTRGCGRWKITEQERGVRSKLNALDQSILGIKYWELWAKCIAHHQKECCWTSRRSDGARQLGEDRQEGDDQADIEEVVVAHFLMGVAGGVGKGARETKKGLVRPQPCTARTWLGEPPRP